MNLSVQSQIIQILKKDERSISGIKSDLEGVGLKLHRLTLSGYLSAMVEAEILKVKEIKPAKVYSLNQKGTVSLYRKIGKAIKETFSENHGDICLSFLYYTFQRPIFIREFELCDIDLPKNYRKSFSTKKITYIKSFQETGIEIPENEMIIEPENINNTQVLRIMRNLILSQNNLMTETSLVDMEQKTLEDI
ncbi:MAG: hypothetical protein M1498_02575 [Candidatus Thermoplasmatota archaeon]|nr:hypothetical protein [Candidatus Thermoplasmatota archaeon]MCL5888838.1 hypothetical protein [Candidatus Thermoplasmatota archaeon]